MVKHALILMESAMLPLVFLVLLIQKELKNACKMFNQA